MECVLYPEVSGNLVLIFHAPLVPLGIGIDYSHARICRATTIPLKIFFVALDANSVVGVLKWDNPLAACRTSERNIYDYLFFDHSWTEDQDSVSRSPDSSAAMLPHPPTMCPRERRCNREYCSASQIIFLTLNYFSQYHLNIEKYYLCFLQTKKLSYGKVKLVIED